MPSHQAQPLAAGQFALHPDVGLVQLIQDGDHLAYLMGAEKAPERDLGWLSPIHFEIVQSPNQMQAIALRGPLPVVRAFLRASLRENRMDQKIYRLRSGAGAFLQCDTAGYVLIEFWNDRGASAFVDYLNVYFHEWLALMMELDLLDDMLDGLSES